jgi:hypothetical protein
MCPSLILVVMIVLADTTFEASPRQGLCEKGWKCCDVRRGRDRRI